MVNMKRYVLILDGVLLAIILLSGFILRGMFALLPPCPFAAMGILCPSCGGTRCIYFLIHGDFGMAFRMNPFIFLTVFYLLAAVILLNVGVLLHCPRAEKIARAMTSWQMVIAFAAAFAVFGLLRAFL